MENYTFLESVYNVDYEKKFSQSFFVMNGSQGVVV